MSDSQSDNTTKALNIVSTALLAIATATKATMAVQSAIERARREGRDMSDEELQVARDASAQADERFTQALASLKD